METKYEFIQESKFKKYYACSDGYVLSVSKKDYSEQKLKGSRKKKSYGYVLLVKINGKEYCVKHLIAKAFIKKYKENESVIFHKNENNEDCSVDNLLIIPKNDVAAITGAMAKQMPITVTYPDGKTEKFNSARSAAKALYCSRQTLIDYMKGTFKSSVLDGIKIKRSPQK